MLAALFIGGLHTPQIQAATLSYEIEGNGTYVGRSKFERGRTNAGSAEQFDTRAHFVVSTQVRDSFLLRLGVDWQSYWFERSADALLPGRMQSLSFIIGADLTFGQAWLARVELMPGFAGTGDDINSSSARIPAVAGVSYIASSDLQFVLGIGIDANRKYPVLPGIGVRWKFAEHWVMNAVLPTPRLEYTPLKDLLLYAGGEIREDTYRVNERLGGTRGVRNLEGTIIDYWEVRAGVGVSWKVRPGVMIDLEGGFVPFREFDFYRARERVSEDEAPGYLRFGVRGSF